MSIRTERVAALLKQDLGTLLQQEYQHNAMVTVTTVRISPDLMQAHIYLSIYSPADTSRENFDLIVEKTPEIRKKLAAKVRHQLRRVPELHFHLDDTAEYVDKMNALFNKIDTHRRGTDDAS